MVHDRILKQIDDENLSVHVIWTSVLASDNFASTEKARTYLPDKRVTHYWDADQSLGRTYAQIVDLPGGRRLAWDVYFAFDRGIAWKAQPPAPTDWMHQLGRDDRLFDGDKLRVSIESLLQEAR